MIFHDIQDIRWFDAREGKVFDLLELVVSESAVDHMCSRISGRMVVVGDATGETPFFGLLAVVRRS